MTDATERPRGPDPLAPLATIGEATIRQRIGGLLFVRWADGREEGYPVGFSVRMIEEELRRRLPPTG